MSEDSNLKIDRFQSSLNSKRTLFNVIVYVILPASLILAFIYSLLLTRENKVDYLLFIVFITVSYTLVTILIDLLKIDGNVTGLKYLMNKLNIDNDVNTEISIVMDNNKNICELNLSYPDNKNQGESIYDVKPTTSKIINGENITNSNKTKLKNDLDKKFYDRCDSLTNDDNLFKNIGVCVGKDNDSMGTCSNSIKSAKNSDDAYSMCTKWEYNNPKLSLALTILLVIIVIIEEVKVYIEGEGKMLVSNIALIIYLLYNFFAYLKSPKCDYIDINYGDIAVSPFSKEVVYTLFVVALIKSISYMMYIIMGLSKDFTKLILCIVILSALYIIKDYSFLNILENNYSGFGKFINIMKLNRKTDRLNYDVSFKEKDTERRCLISGTWDKTNRGANIKGEMDNCNSEELGKYLGNIM